MSDPNTLKKAIEEKRRRNSLPKVPNIVSTQPQPQPQAQPQPQQPEVKVQALSVDPITTPGWFKKRPKHLKGFIDKAHTPSLKAAVERARAHRQKKAIQRAGPKPYLDEIIVLGERVILDETHIKAISLFGPQDDSEFVYFTPSYFAEEKNVNKIIQAKTVFSKVFAPGTNFGVDNPVPPCEISEYNLLKEGLENRLYLLRVNLPSYIDDTISMIDRNKYHQAEMITSIIHSIESNDSICTKYELNLKSGVSTELKGFVTPISRADSERMRNLLRQFSFLVLQSMNPISGYENSVGVDANALIQALEQNQISKNEMDQYIAEYNESAHEIPDVISQALESTDTQESVYALMLEGELANLITYVNKHILENLSDPNLKTKFTNYTKSIGTSAVKDQIVSILKWIIEEYNGHKKIISDNLNTLQVNQGETGRLRQELAEKDEKIMTLESNLVKVSSDLKTSKSELENVLGAPIDNMADSDKLSASHGELREELAKRTGERDVLDNKLKDLIKESDNALKSNLGAKQTLGALEGALSIASNPKFVGFLSKVRMIADSVNNNSTPPSDGDPFKILYNEFSEHPEFKSSDICYLNYYIIFFIKSIFSIDPDLFDILNNIVSTNLAKHKDVDNHVEDFSSMLSKSEASKKDGYYLTDVKTTQEFKDLYNALKDKNDINNRCYNTIKKAFPGYSPKPIFFVPALEDSTIEANGFLIKSRNADVNNMPMYKWNATQFEAVDNVAPVKITSMNALPYSTFFLLFILYGKEYLIKKQDSRCPIPSFVKDPGQLRISFKTPVEVKSVVPKN